MEVSAETATQILIAMTLGVTKEKCKYVTDQDSSDFWDELFAEVEQMKKDGIEVSIPEL